MKIVAIICNIVLFGFSCLVLMTDGISKEASYNVLALLLLVVPILSVFVIYRSGSAEGWPGVHRKEKASEEQRKIAHVSSMTTTMKIMAVIGNIVLFGFVCWAVVSQYPHPDEAGVIEFTLLSVLTPILNLVVVLRSEASDGWAGVHIKRKPLEGQNKTDDPAGKT